MSFVYLQPGNWFDIRLLSEDKLWPYDYDAFCLELVSQVEQRAELLDFIKSPHKENKKKTVKESIDILLTRDRFERMAGQMIGEKYQPIITFHGTNSDATNAIIESGYIIPQLNKGSGVKVSNGAMYGVGVYTSPFYAKAFSYNRRAGNGQSVLIVNFVLPGKIRMIPTNYRPDGSLPVDGWHKDGSNTKVVFGLDQIISADPQRVIPLAIISSS